MRRPHIRAWLGRAGVAARVIAGALALATAPAAGAEDSPSGPHFARLDGPASLAGTWRFRVGDDPAFAAPSFADADWSRIRVPGPWGRQGHRGHAGFAWYRLTLTLGEAAAASARAGVLGVRLGNVDSSYVLYAGGEAIGGVGGLPPAPRLMYDRHAVFALPARAVDGDGRVVLALRVWRAPVTREFQGGITSGPVTIGPLAALQRDLLLREIATVALVVLFTLAAFYHLYLFWRRRSLREYLWFGASSLLFAAYTFLRSQIKYGLSEDFELLKKLEYVALYAIPIPWLQFFPALFSRRTPAIVRVGQVLSGALAVGVAVAPGIGFGIASLTFWELCAAGFTAGIFVLVASELRRGHPEARMIAGGFALFAVGVANDILRDFGWLQTPRLTPYAFAVFTLSMAASLAHRFARTYAELERLNVDLAEHVRAQTFALEDRTAELESKNKQLEAAYRQLREASLVDPMTSLSNRRFYQEHIAFDVARVLREHETAAAGRSAGGATPSSLIFLLVDVDWFKRINDRLGHRAGDETLGEVGRVLRSVCRGSDYLVRWGGEEFLIVSRFVDRAGAAVLAERVRAAVEAHRFPAAAEAGGRITVSVGFACYPLYEAEPLAVGHEDVLELADACLYRVKEAGRNGWLGILRGVGPPGALPLGRRAAWSADAFEIASSRSR